MLSAYFNLLYVKFALVFCKLLIYFFTPIAIFMNFHRICKFLYISCSYSVYLFRDPFPNSSNYTFTRGKSFQIHPRFMGSMELELLPCPHSNIGRSLSCHTARKNPKYWLRLFFTKKATKNCENHTVNLCLVSIKYENPSWTNITVPHKYVFDFKE